MKLSHGQTPQKHLRSLRNGFRGFILEGYEEAWEKVWKAMQGLCALPLSENKMAYEQLLSLGAIGSVIAASWSKKEFMKRGLSYERALRGFSGLTKEEKDFVRRVWEVFVFGKEGIWTVKESVVKFIGKCGELEDLRLLSKGLEDKHYMVRAASLTSLKELAKKWQEAKQIALKQAENNIKSPSNLKKNSAILIFGEFGGNEHLESLKPMLKSKKNLIKRALKQAVEKINKRLNKSELLASENEWRDG